MKINVYRFLLAGMVLLFTTLACNALSGIGQQAQEVRATAFSVGTDIGQGRELFGTLQAVGTQVAGSGAMETLQAAATRVEESGALDTAAAFATQEGSQLLETAQAFATEEGPGLEQTAQAFITQQGPAFVETMQAAATEVAASVGDLPPDIPMLEGERSNLVASNVFVSYGSPAPFAEALAFYKTQMPLNGWTEAPDQSFEGENNAVLTYHKGDRTATVTINVSPVNNGSLVVIAIV